MNSTKAIEFWYRGYWGITRKSIGYDSYVSIATGKSLIGERKRAKRVGKAWGTWMFIKLCWRGGGSSTRVTAWETAGRTLAKAVRFQGCLVDANGLGN